MTDSLTGFKQSDIVGHWSGYVSMSDLQTEELAVTFVLYAVTHSYYTVITEMRTRLSGTNVFN